MKAGRFFLPPLSAFSARFFSLDNQELHGIGFADGGGIRKGCAFDVSLVCYAQKSAQHDLMTKC